MKKTAELSLTKESIANEGIDIKLTQSDVIDALVEEQISSIVSQVETLRLSTKALAESVTQEFKVCVDAALVKAPLSKTLTIVEHDYSRGHRDRDNTITLTDVSDLEVRGGSTIYRKTNHCHVVLQGESRLSVRYEGIVDGINVVGRFETMFPFKYSKKLVKAIEEHNKRVDALVEILPEKGINEKDIARKIKNQFTKEILKTSSPEFRQKMQEGFGIIL